MFEKLKKKSWTSRSIHPTAYAPFDTFYYKGANGRIHTVNLKERTIREHFFEMIDGFSQPIPTIMTRIIRRFNLENETLS